MTLPHVPELLLILVIVLLIFGAGKLPNVAGSMGQAIRDFRKNVQPEDESTQTNQASVESDEKSGANST
jgi:sec-independent protein translocase protein TatA